MAKGENYDSFDDVWAAITEVISAIGIEGFSKIIITLCACIGAYVAWQGLKSWEKQTIWKRKFDLAIKYYDGLVKL